MTIIYLNVTKKKNEIFETLRHETWKWEMREILNKNDENIFIFTTFPNFAMQTFADG